ncbi:MAG TPA: glycosyltransferase family 2 protein [Blastocatellia bacterium]|nr:glycosyltransferase family 2 protein [Blastocatellia bacterium]
MLDQITPVILTYNEAPNISRNLERLDWARDVIVVDSFSEDETVSLARQIEGVRVFQRRFDTLANQWNFALAQTQIRTEWVLALDADYILTDEIVDELRSLAPDSATTGYSANFVYCVHGQRLRSSAYPPVTVLFRHSGATYRQDGHAHRVVLEGAVRKLKYSILHDDRKPLGHWLNSQEKYMRLELEKLRQSEWRDLSWPDKIRRLRIIAPFLMFFYCLFVKRAILDGRAGIYYAFQRMLAELLLSLYLIEFSLDGRDEKTVSAQRTEQDKKAFLPVEQSK